MSANRQAITRRLCITAALIAHVQGEEAEIDLWIMSCRVFKRKLEHAMFDRLTDACRKAGVKRLRGHYYPTAKNLLMKDFYATIGFEQINEDEAGNREFVFEVPAAPAPLCDVMEIKLV